MATLVKVHFEMPENLDEFFTLIEGNLIMLNVVIPGLDDGDHLLFFNGIDVRQRDGAVDFSQWLKDNKIRTRMRTHFVILKAGTGNDNLLGYATFLCTGIENFPLMSLPCLFNVPLTSL